MPRFSTMNSLFVPSSGAAMATGRRNPEATWVVVALISSSGTVAAAGRRALLPATDEDADATDEDAAVTDEDAAVTDEDAAVTDEDVAAAAGGVSAVMGASSGRDKASNAGAAQRFPGMSGSRGGLRRGPEDGGSPGRSASGLATRPARPHPTPKRAEYDTRPSRFRALTCPTGRYRLARRHNQARDPSWEAAPGRSGHLLPL
ncbi:hypothetical protein GCM10022226_13540 [Sphaerisporangium flaviroseum]|uniref:Uncharacterized protein n=1 Tax=Sphaerisporangium flaviroseum TaxID=509199 RepID=A0ABP7HI06_9ACTN